MLTHLKIRNKKLTQNQNKEEIEGEKAARLLKKKGDVDIQSTYHEDDIKDTVCRFITKHLGTTEN